jgi:hypothetical protein
MVRAAGGKVRPIPKDLPAPLRQQLQAMLDPRPERRPSAAALVGGPAGTLVRRPLAARRPRWPLWMAAGSVSAVAIVAGLAVASRETGDAAPPPTTAPPATTTTECPALPYQPCGAAEPAPGTDGTVCLAGHEDYDLEAENGCEAADDGLPDDVVFPEGAPAAEATIVPRDDVDTFAMPVGDGFQLFCDGRFTVALTAPAGMALRLELFDGGDLLAETTSADGVTAALRVDERDCLGSDARTLVARVTPIGSDRTGAPYQLERSGSF